jgi:hypothetical protein
MARKSFPKRLAYQFLDELNRGFIAELQEDYNDE